MINRNASLAGLRILAIVGQVILVKLFTHYLSPAQLGNYYFFLTLSYSLNALLFVPVDYFQQAEVFRLHSSGRSLQSILRLNCHMLLWVTAASLCTCAVAAIVRPTLLEATTAAITLSASLYFSTAIKNFLNNRDDQLLVVAMLVAEVPVRIAVFLALLKMGLLNALTPLWATTASFVIVASPALLRVRKHWLTFSGPHEELHWGKILRFGSPISFASILNWLQLQGYRLVLVPMGYVEAVGLFAATSAIGTRGMNAAATVYQQIYLPKIYQSRGYYLKTYLRGLGFVILLVSLVGALFRIQLTALLTNHQFVPYAWAILYGVLVEAGNFVIAGLVVRLTLDDNTMAQVKANVIAVLFVPIAFALLFAFHLLTPVTIGIPLLIAQVIVIVGIMLHSETRSWKIHKNRTQEMRSLL